MTRAILNPQGKVATSTSGLGRIVESGTSLTNGLNVTPLFPDREEPLDDEETNSFETYPFFDPWARASQSFVYTVLNRVTDEERQIRQLESIGMNEIQDQKSEHPADRIPADLEEFL